MQEESIEDLRREIAETTKEIIRLAARRTDLARRVGVLKTKSGLPQEDPAVEGALLNEVIAESAKAGLDRRVALKVFSVLLTESKKSQGLPEKPSPMSSFAKALALQRQGVKLIRLDVGEPDFKPPKQVLQACSDALFGFKTHYTESKGIPELSSALRGYLLRKRGFNAEPGQLAVTPSGRFAVFAGLASCMSEGESALVLEPNWPAYADIVRYIGGTPIPVRTSLEQNWEPDLSEVRRLIRPNTKALVLSYPNNPTGKIISPETFRRLSELADERGLTVLSDEIYNEYSYKKCPSVFDFPPKKFILTSSFSKTWAMTGFRVGYAVSDPDTIASVVRMTSLAVTSVPEFIQYGAIAALDSDQEVGSNVSEMAARIDLVDRSLRKIPSLEFSRPDGAIYFFPRLKDFPGGGEAFASEMLKRGVSVTPGRSFGDYPDHFRISLGQPQETLREGIERMGDLLK